MDEYETMNKLKFGNYIFGISIDSGTVSISIYTVDNMLIDTIKLPENYAKSIIYNYLCNLYYDYNHEASFLKLPLFNTQYQYTIYSNTVNEGASIKIVIYKLKINTNEDICLLSTIGNFSEYIHFIRELSMVVNKGDCDET
jgi:hypothetical protein